MINYELLGNAQKYYQDRGYNYIEVPWMVSEHCDNITKPEDVKAMVIDYNGKHLIASGEQGFLYLRMKGYLPSVGNYQTITPCFRNEPYDNTHQKMFMKCELIRFVDNRNTMEQLHQELDIILKDAYEFFKQYVNDPKELYQVNVTNTASRHSKSYANYDIMYNGFELGSYGIREYNDIAWIYGTGLAEPRFSKINSIILRENV